MTAAGKITASEIGKRPLGSVRVLITDNRTGRAATDPTGDGPWFPAYNKTGMVAATVTNVGYARGNRRSRIDLVTDRGEVNDLSPSQTFWLAPAAPAPIAPAAQAAPAPVPAAPSRITVKQLQHTEGVRVLLVDRHNQYAGGGAGEWTAARIAPPRGELYVKGERAEVHAATVTEVRRLPGAGVPRYDVVTNLGTVERVTAAQAFRLAPASMRDTADMRAESRANIEQREARTAAALADMRERAAESDAKAVRDRAEARRFLAEIAPEPASDAPSDRVRIERHRASVTQGEVSVYLDGELLARYGDQMELCNVGHEPGSHEDGAVCFGGFHGLPDAHWYEVANRIAARRALVEPVYTAAARSGVDFHALADATRTTCNQSTRTGQIRERAAVVSEHGAKPCAECFPPTPAAVAAPAVELRHPVEGRGCANAEAAAQLVAGRPSRTLTARRVPEVGCAVYDARTGEKVYPAGERWLPNLRAARVKCAELLAVDIAERREEGRRQIAAELAAYEAATAGKPGGTGRAVISGPHAPIGSVRVCDVGGEHLDGPWFLVSAGPGDRWTADRGAACATHCGHAEPAAGTALASAPTGYAAAVEAAAERAPWATLRSTTDGRRAYVVHDGAADKPRSAARPIRGDGGTVRVEYVTEDGKQVGAFGWEDPATLVPPLAVDPAPFVSDWSTYATAGK